MTNWSSNPATRHDGNDQHHTMEKVKGTVTSRSSIQGTTSSITTVSLMPSPYFDYRRLPGDPCTTKIRHIWWLGSGRVEEGSDGGGLPKFETDSSDSDKKPPLSKSRSRIKPPHSPIKPRGNVNFKAVTFLWLLLSTANLLEKKYNRISNDSGSLVSCFPYFKTIEVLLEKTNPFVVSWSLRGKQTCDCIDLSPKNNST